jgi:hypothetical protein
MCPASWSWFLDLLVALINQFMDAWLWAEKPCCLLYGMASSDIFVNGLLALILLINMLLQLVQWLVVFVYCLWAAPIVYGGLFWWVLLNSLLRCNVCCCRGACHVQGASLGLYLLQWLRLVAGTPTCYYWKCWFVGADPTIFVLLLLLTLDASACSTIWLLTVSCYVVSSNHLFGVDCYFCIWLCFIWLNSHALMVMMFFLLVQWSLFLLFSIVHTCISWLASLQLSFILIYKIFYIW